jgi:hypothetical protein
VHSAIRYLSDYFPSAVGADVEGAADEGTSVRYAFEQRQVVDAEDETRISDQLPQGERDIKE